LGVGTILNDDAASTLKLTVSPGAFSENAGTSAAAATLTRTGATDTAVMVALSSNDESEATVPAMVEIPIGQSVVTFPVAAQNDTEADGTQTVTLTAMAAEYTPASATVNVTDDEQPPFAAYFDFGTGTSPLSPNFTPVSEATTYSPALGYGWTSGVVGSRDRGTRSALDRDMNYTTDATFAVNLPNGLYRVDVLLGDRAGYTHDYVGVFLEGQQRDSVTTSGGQIVSRTFEVQVLDGQLTLRLADLGGGDGNCVIEALRIVDTASGPPQSSSPWWPVRDNIPGAVFTESYNANGFLYHDVDSTYQRTTNNIRVLLPANYDPNQVYQVIYVLPVEAGNRTQFGDGLSTVRDLGLQNSRNVIFVAPSFSETPWFVDHVSNSSIWQETFFRTVVVPFIEQQYSTSGLVEDRLLLGFSKSGYGAVSMLLRHPDFFGRAAVWDAPLAMSDPASGWDFLGVLGSRDNFHANFQITNQIATLGHNLQGQAPRIFLLGYSYDFTRQDHATVDALMTQYSVPHVYFPGVYRQHVWASGWIPEVVDQLLSP
ncbi:MAG: alpha/beta hydrolase-fold protein, partial [Pirellulaceae bacterium]